MSDPWNRCDVCGKFIAMRDFEKGAVRHMVTPDSDRSREEWETLCLKHGLEDRAVLMPSKCG
jgi:hypothetical protein